MTNKPNLKNLWCLITSHLEGWPIKIGLTAWVIFLFAFAYSLFSNMA